MSSFTPSLPACFRRYSTPASSRTASMPSSSGLTRLQPLPGKRRPGAGEGGGRRRAASEAARDERRAMAAHVGGREQVQSPAAREGGQASVWKDCADGGDPGNRLVLVESSATAPAIREPSCPRSIW